MDLFFVVTNCPTAQLAEAIGRAALGGGLTKAVNISAPMKTMYIWNGELVENEEVQLIFKVAEANLQDLTALIEQHHPFETPSIVAWRIDHTTPQYRDFISNS